MLLYMFLHMLSVRVPHELNISAFPPVLRDWLIKGPGMSSRACATGHIKDSVPRNEKRRGLSTDGRFPPGFIHKLEFHRENRTHRVASGRKT